MKQDISSQFGVSWPHVVAQLVFLTVIIAAVVLAIRATIVSLRTFRGALTPLWILLCWLVPIFGPIAALVAARIAIELEARHVA